MSSPKFKVGDKVRIKCCDDLQQTEKISPEMLQYQKMEATITEVFDDDGYNYLLDVSESYWYWYEDMIDFVEAAPVDIAEIAEKVGNMEPTVSELETSCEHKALLRHYDGCFVTFCPRCGKILHIYYATKLYKGYALIEGRIRELENKIDE